jgi:hypothetical protein
MRKLSSALQELRSDDLIYRIVPTDILSYAKEPSLAGKQPRGMQSAGSLENILILAQKRR